MSENLKNRDYDDNEWDGYAKDSEERERSFKQKQHTVKPIEITPEERDRGLVYTNKYWAIRGKFKDWQKTLMNEPFTEKEAGETLKYYLEQSKNYLDYKYGINNLSFIEETKLKEIAEKYLNEERMYRKMYTDIVNSPQGQTEEGWQEAGEIERSSPNLDNAIAQKWLFEMYGIFWEDIQKFPFEARAEYINGLRKNAHSERLGFNELDIQK